MEPKMQNRCRRTPRYYSGTHTTAHSVKDLLASAMEDLRKKNQGRPDLILASWPELIGEKLAGMTQAVSFEDGILLVKVKNSTLHSLLELHEKPKLLKCLRRRFPNVLISHIIFRMG